MHNILQRVNCQRLNANCRDHIWMSIEGPTSCPSEKTRLLFATRQFKAIRIIEGSVMDLGSLHCVKELPFLSKCVIIAFELHGVLFRVHFRVIIRTFRQVIKGLGFWSESQSQKELKLHFGNYDIDHLTFTESKQCAATVKTNGTDAMSSQTQTGLPFKLSMW